VSFARIYSEAFRLSTIIGHDPGEIHLMWASKKKLKAS